MLTEWYPFRATFSIGGHDLSVSERRRRRDAQKQPSMRLETHRALIEVLRDVLLGEDVQEKNAALLKLPGSDSDGVFAEEEEPFTEDAPLPYSVTDPHIRVKVTREREYEGTETSNKRLRGEN